MELRTQESVLQQPETRGSLTLDCEHSSDAIPISGFEENVRVLLSAYYDEAKRKSILEIFRKHPVLKAHEIAAAAYLLSALEEGIDLGFSFLRLEAFSSGAVKLFRYGGFPWGGLPYPGEHAELGLLLLKIGEFYDEAIEKATSMIAYQQALFTHEERILPSLWSQGGIYREKEITKTSKSFLYQVGKKPFSEYCFMDKELGFWMRRSLSSSAFVTASGCRSGMGAFLISDVGVITYGPHCGEIDSSKGFGLSALAKDFTVNEEKDLIEISFISRASGVLLRNSYYKHLVDSGVGPNLFSKVVVSENFFTFQSTLLETSPHTFSLFFRGKTCSVAGGPALRATAPDSYKGPMASVVICGENERVRLTFFTSCNEIKIFSLSGCSEFWGADFLVNVSYKNGKIEGKVERD